MGLSKSLSVAYIFPVVIICYTFSLLWGWFPRTHTIYVLFLGVLACLFLCQDYFRTKQVTYLLLLEVVLGLNMLMNDHLHASAMGFVYEMISIAITAMMGCYLLKAKNETLVTATTLMLLLMLIVNVVGSLFVETIFPGSIRAVVTEFHDTGSQDLAMAFYKFGMASYEMTHAIPTIIPMVVYGIKVETNVKTKIFFIIILIACLLLCYLGGSTTALLLGMFALVLSLFTKTDQGKSQLVLFGLLAVVFMLVLSNDSLMLSLLDWADNMMGNEGNFHSKIVDFQFSIESSGSSESTAGRGDLYMQSVNAILSNPLLGTNSDTMGHHSTILDHWACLGLIGLIPYLAFIYFQLKWTSRYIPVSSKTFFVEGAGIAILMLAVKSIDGWESWLFLFTFMPIMARYIETKKKPTIQIANGNSREKKRLS